MPREKIVIIGGGFTGLVAARELVRSGEALEITVVERGAELGGLAAGFPFCGTTLEKAYHHLFLTDSAILGLIRDLGLEDRLVWGDSSIGVYLEGRVHPFLTPLDLLRFSPCGLLGRLRLGLAGLYLQRTKDWRPLAAQTARAWLARACGADAMRTVWEPLLQGKFAEHAGDISMAWLWARIHTRAGSRRAGGEKLGYLRGGFAVVTSKLEEELRAAGVQVRVHATVEKLNLDEGQRSLVVDGEVIPFDRCVFTGSSEALAQLLPATPVFAEYRCKLASIDYLGAVCVVFASEQSIAGHYWTNVHEAEAPFLLVVQHTRLSGTEAYQGRHVYYLGCYQRTNGRAFQQSEAALVEEWFGYLKKIFPQFDAGRVQERHVFRFGAAQHVVDTGYEAKIPGRRTPAPGIYLANFSQIFPEDRGTNFAVREGTAAARTLLEDRGAGHG